MKSFKPLLKYIVLLNTPRWMVLGVDTFLSLGAFYFSMFILYNLNNQNIRFSDYYLVSVIVVLFRLQGFLIARSYRGIIKYTSTQDAVRMSLAILLSSLGIFFTNYIYEFNTGKRMIPLSLQFIDFFVLVSWLATFRIGVKHLYRLFEKSTVKSTNMIIFGAGESGFITKKAIDGNMNIAFKVVAYFDDDPQLIHKTIDGVRIHNFDEEFEEVYNKFKPSTLIISTSNISPPRLKLLVNSALQKGVKVQRSPDSEKWINGEFSFNQIESIKIEDLLGRDSIQLNNKHIASFIKGKRILITGAAGSIGSELVRQCLPFSPGQIVMLDQSETPLHDLQLELQAFKNTEAMVADVCNEQRMRKVFDHYRPEVVFHAAAYKHVPLMEENPYEAINTNVFGTRILANLAVEYRTDKFVLISTDKAVNPTNIMGASKRIAEMYVQSICKMLNLKKEVHTRFITTRFGNVLGSNGSVIPLFKKQIEEGGPVTVTHPEITRYFMTIPEACQLVLEAGSMGQGGEIFIFDMGNSVKIADLAARMIELSGFTVDEDIKIEFTGLRPGEKLKEELLNDKENTIGTYHPKIMIAKVREYDYFEVNANIEFLYENKDRIDNVKLVKMMKTIVPEFMSNNSVYQTLDTTINKKT